MFISVERNEEYYLHYSMIVVRLMVLVQFMYVLQYSKRGMKCFWAVYNIILILIFLSFAILSLEHLEERAHYTRAGRLVSLTESVNITCLMVH